MMSKKRKLSKTEIAVRIEKFKTAVTFFQGYFGLVSWRISVFGTRNNVRGSLTANEEYRCASIFYGEEWIKSEDATDEDIAKVAFHETLELLIYPSTFKLAHYIDFEYAQEQSHVVIRMLENRLFPYAYEELKSSKKPKKRK